MERDQQFVTDLVKEIVNHPEEVVVDRKTDELGVLLTVRVHREDMGIVIGRAGSNAGAIRTILRAVGAKQKSRLNVKFEEPEGSTHFHNRPRVSSIDEALGRTAPKGEYEGHEEGSSLPEGEKS